VESRREKEVVEGQAGEPNCEQTRPPAPVKTAYNDREEKQEDGASSGQATAIARPQEIAARP